MRLIVNVGYYLTEDCPLRCDYCFVSKNPKRSNFDVGKATIDWLLSPEISGNTKQISISFFGGEPMLEMDLLKQLVEYGEGLNQKNQKKIKFSITSNGTLLTEELLDYFVKHNINILFSIDGDEETQNKHRKTADGRGSWSMIQPILKSFVKKQPQNVARMTICSDTASKTFENVKYLIEGVGFKNIAPTPVGDSYLNWDNDSIAVMDKEYEKIEKWIADRIRRKVNNPICIGYLQKAIKANLRKQPMTSPCGAGKGYAGIGVDGGVYPCHRFVQWEEWKLGTVFERKLDEEKRKQFLEFDKNRNSACKDCSVFFCGGQCLAQNIVFGKRLDSFNPQICRLNKFLQRAAVNLIKEFGKDPHFLNMFPLKQRPRIDPTDIRRLYEQNMLLARKINNLEREMSIVKQVLRKVDPTDSRLFYHCPNCPERGK